MTPYFFPLLSMVLRDFVCNSFTVLYFDNNRPSSGSSAVPAADLRGFFAHSTDLRVRIVHYRNYNASREENLVLLLAPTDSKMRLVAQQYYSTICLLCHRSAWPLFSLQINTTFINKILASRSRGYTFFVLADGEDLARNISTSIKDLAYFLDLKKRKLFEKYKVGNTVVRNYETCSRVEME